MDLRHATNALVEEVRGLAFGPCVSHSYNPLVYARRPHMRYLQLYGRGRREVLLLGMNPGPWGMAQTGVPFGEVNFVRDWLGIHERVDRPAKEHPKRPVRGFECPRSEVSGARLWGWARDTFDTPTRFFTRFFIANYCPLCFMDSGGRNITPDKLPAPERKPLLAACDRALQRTVEYFRPRFVIGIGRFAEKRALAALDGMDVAIGRILHPSPASPRANMNWAETVTAELRSIGISLPG